MNIVPVRNCSISVNHNFKWLWEVNISPALVKKLECYDVFPGDIFKILTGKMLKTDKNLTVLRDINNLKIHQPLKVTQI